MNTHDRIKKKSESLEGWLTTGPAKSAEVTIDFSTAGMQSSTKALGNIAYGQELQNTVMGLEITLFTNITPDFSPPVNQYDRWVS
ncbi:unnamed protein product [Acanthoscelides obtectus]|uniref:Uncharacterized protein n=1 Tax=Acanthoscelides obtectus TaxID=200917 RepID=A0A9P0LP92_ACAOB|nr:unnamed protein product [Acanthoscelides obtectus]CAK1649449.1 hypothetical protein AOBTE_LOCUS16245 [Acanthoscelides obtectus]